MIKLSDYLDYLNSEIIQARKKADEYAVKVAKEYAKNDYLKYFKVPRYSMPNVKMDIPLKIADIDSETKFSFNSSKEELLKNINENIVKTNKAKNLKIPVVTESQINKPAFNALLTNLEKNSKEKEIKNTNEIKTEVKKINFSNYVKVLNVGKFRVQDGNEDEVMKQILAESVMKNYKISSSALNKIMVDPNTTSAEDKDKIFINLHVEMEEEGIRIVELQDKTGKTIEEIIFE